MSSINYSQRGQDLFVVDILKGKKNGTFLDFGCQGPKHINNTYLLEKNYNFTGLSFDIDSVQIDNWNNTDRNSKNSICCDLLNDTNIAFEKMENFYSTNIIDYFSFDLEPPLLTVDVLKKIPLNKYKFGVVTFEHDDYRNYDTLRPSRKIFIENGYKKVKQEYMHLFDETKSIHQSEDWWIHPDIISVNENILDNM
jgi:hypothetical protein